MIVAGVGVCRSSRGVVRNSSSGGKGRRRSHLCGFTLVELVMVMVVGAVLAIFAAPKLLSISDFNARGFHDETTAFLRYAQKAAIAQRRPVCVVFSAGGAVLRIDADRDVATGPNGCEADVTGPSGITPGSIAARGSVQYLGTPAVVVFDGLGTPAAGATIQVGGAARQITVESTTGYVHD